MTIEMPSWSTVTRIKGAGGISLGDSSAAALALEEEATLVVGADPEFGNLLRTSTSFRSVKTPSNRTGHPFTSVARPRFPPDWSFILQ